MQCRYKLKMWLYILNRDFSHIFLYRSNFDLRLSTEPITRVKLFTLTSSQPPLSKLSQNIIINVLIKNSLCKPTAFFKTVYNLRVVSHFNHSLETSINLMSALHLNSRVCEQQERYFFIVFTIVNVVNLWLLFAHFMYSVTSFSLKATVLFFVLIELYIPKNYSIFL